MLSSYLVVLAAVGAYEAVGERFSRFFNFNYGQACMGIIRICRNGTCCRFHICYQSTFKFLVRLIAWFNIIINHHLWKSDEEINAKERIEDNEDEAVPSMHRILSLLKVKDLWIIIIFITFSWSFYTIFDQQMFPDFYTKLFSSTSVGQQMYGTLNSVQVFLEAIMMGIVPIIMSKIVCVKRYF